MNNKYFIDVIDRLIRTGLTLDDAIELLSNFIAEYMTFGEEIENDNINKLS